jgi:hypothetical protein
MDHLEYLLHIPPKKVKREHVENQVHPPTVQKTRRKEAEIFLAPRDQVGAKQPPPEKILVLEAVGTNGHRNGQDDIGKGE